jgi:hypothetical protein
MFQCFALGCAADGTGCHCESYSFSAAVIARGRIAGAKNLLEVSERTQLIYLSGL